MAKHTKKRGSKIPENPRYIYDYRPGGVFAGKQVRFKRQKDKEVESTSEYFSVARYGSPQAALAAAVRWLEQNKRWMSDRRFKPRPAKHPEHRSNSRARAA